MPTRSLFSTRGRRLIGLLILILSLAVLLWGVWPLGELVRTLHFSPADMQLPGPEGLILLSAGRI